MNRFSSEYAIIFLGTVWIIFGVGVLIAMFMQPQPVTITWSTETEFETAGFNIYRSEFQDGEYAQINQQLIPGKAEAAAGAVYSWQDTNAQPGMTYYYKLEDVEYNNTRTLHEPFSHRARSFSTIKTAISACGFVLGAVLLWFGIAQTKRKKQPNRQPNSRQVAT
ncbi:MAG: hypothetical protein AAF902_20620 [Chloroflexota bacterium]